MHTLFTLLAVIAFLAGAYFFIRLIFAVIRGQPKGGFLKKLVAATVIFVGMSVGSGATNTTPVSKKTATTEVTKQAPEQKLIDEQKKLLDEKKDSAEVQPPPKQEAQQPAEKPKTKADEEFEKNYAKLSDESKAFYEETFQSLRTKEGLFSAHAYTEQEAREEAMERALNKQRQADKVAAKDAKEQADKLAQAQQDLEKFQNEYNVSYQDLGDGTSNVSITLKHGSMYMRINDKHEYYDPADKEKMYMVRECAQIVQMFNDASVKVNHFTITMTGPVINPNGDKWEDTVAVCEFDNQKFPRDDFQSFYNKCSRFWILESK